MSSKKVKANKGSARVDGVDFKKFEANLENNLYKLWNRLSSGSYMPPAVLRVGIPTIPFERYADDAVCHCKSEVEANQLKEALIKRLEECKLELHPDKTKIVYCKDEKRRSEYENISFDFLGFTFQPRLAKNSKTGKFFVGFNPAISTKSAKRIRLVMRRWKVQLRSDLSLEEISKAFSRVIRGWVNITQSFHDISFSI